MPPMVNTGAEISPDLPKGDAVCSTMTNVPVTSPSPDIENMTSQIENELTDLQEFLLFISLPPELPMSPTLSAGQPLFATNTTLLGNSTNKHGGCSICNR